MTSKQIEELEQRMRVVLDRMVKDGRFQELWTVLGDAISNSDPSAGSYQLLFKTQARGFGNPHEGPFHVNLLGVMGTATSTSSDEVKGGVAYGAVDMKGALCPHCKGSGFASE
jgi:hypothetical protein